MYCNFPTMYLQRSVKSMMIGCSTLSQADWLILENNARQLYTLTCPIVRSGNVWLHNYLDPNRAYPFSKVQKHLQSAAIMYISLNWTNHRIEIQLFCFIINYKIMENEYCLLTGSIAIITPCWYNISIPWTVEFGGIYTGMISELPYFFLVLPVAGKPIFCQ